MVFMIKIVFCDDDMSTLNEIKELLEQYQVERNQEITYKAFHSPLELLEEIEAGMEPDVLFLDIMMPGEDGISTAREIRRCNGAVKIVFLTSSPEFAVDSYTVGAYSYQMKPICAQKLFWLLDAIVEDCQREQQEGIVVCSRSRVIRIPLEKLEYCEVVGRKLHFCLKDRSVIESRGSLEKLWGELSQHGDFIRPHRSFLVNMKYIQSISGRRITMENQAEIPIPHGKCKSLREQYLAYAFDKRQMVIV